MNDDNRSLEPQEVNRGWFFPISIVRMLEKGIINAEQFVLLGKINALCDEKKGCWASNRWIGQQLDKSSDHVSRMVSQLVELELIEVKVLEGNRRTIWPLFQDDRKGKRWARTPRVIRTDAQGGGHGCPGQLSITSKYNKKQTVPLPSRVARRHKGRSVLLPSLEQEIDPFIRKCAFRLEKYIRLSRKISPIFRRSKWYQEFHLLLKALDGDKIRLKSVLKSYTTREHDQFTPQADSAESFRRKFIQIEQWITKADGGEVQDPSHFVRHKKLPNGEVDIELLPGYHQ